MRILILGAGALGGLVGAQLTLAGEDVTLLEVNTARARLLSEDGLLISRAGEQEVCVPLRVVTSVEGLEPFDLVFVAVKTYETEEAVRAVLSACSPKTLFLSLQNGAGNAEKLSAIVGAERVLCGITYHSIQHAGPRRLQYRAGIKPIQIAPCVGGSTPAMVEVAETFKRAGFTTEVVPDVQHAIWQKLLHNAVINPTSALTGLTCRELMADPDLMAFMRSICDEIVAVMRAKGIPIVNEEDPFRPLIGSLMALAKNRPSMWQDLSRGKRTEVDALNGAVVDEAERLGLHAPHNAAITNFIHSRERHTFLRREEIVEKLGIVEHRPAPAASPAIPATPKKALDAVVAGALPLDSTRKLLELMHGYYVRLNIASSDPYRRVAVCSALGPAEIIRAFGLAPYFPEHHAVLISVAGQAARCIARAGAEGFSQFASSAMRSDIGALLEARSPLTTLFGIPAPPRPDLAVYNTSAGQDVRRWFELYGSHYNVPAIGFDPPPASPTADRGELDASIDQLLRLIEQLELHTHRTLELSRLADVVRLSAEASELWTRVLNMAHAVPSPLTFFDAAVHVAPMMLLRGTQEAVDYYRLLGSELEHRVSEGIGAVHEEYRFYWDGPPVWSASRTLADVFAARGVAIVASSYASSFALSNLDGDDPIQSLAGAYMNIFDNQPESFQTSTLASRFAEYGVDAAVFHDCRTSPSASHVRYGMGARVERLTGVPALVLEADAHDPRLFSAERLEGQLGDFIEQHRERFVSQLVAS
jgi:2-dehydropantoate 2-reductase